MRIKAIYVDNFRGFHGTYIPIADVNFMVGENSTGKTSILSLLSLVTSFDFWVNGLFRVGDTDVDFGFYGDIDNIHRVGGKTTIAIQLRDDYTGTGRGKQTQIGLSLCVSGDDSGKSKIDKIKVISHDGEFKAILKDGVTHSKYDKGNIYDEKKFITWVEDDFNIDKSYTVNDSVIRKRTPYFLIMDEIRANGNDVNIIRLVQEVFNETLTWVSPIRAKPQKTYDNYVYEFSPDGTHTPYVLRDLETAENRKSSKVKNEVNSFGQASNLFKNIEVKMLGDDPNSPFTLEVTLTEKPLKIINVGYGISQVLPIVIEILRRKSSSRSWYSIQQPEVHLHPKAQASLGQLIFKSSYDDGSRFIIETHSDFIIDRYRQLMSDTTDKSKLPRTQTIFFSRDNEGNKAYIIGIDENGKYSAEQPPAFRNFFIDEEISNLKI